MGIHVCLLGKFLFVFAYVCVYAKNAGDLYSYSAKFQSFFWVSSVWLVSCAVSGARSVLPPDIWDRPMPSSIAKGGFRGEFQRIVSVSFF